MYISYRLHSGQYEILFGDNLFGRIPINLAIIVASYRICNGTDADGVYNFQSDSNLFISGPITTVPIHLQAPMQKQLILLDLLHFVTLPLNKSRFI